MICSGRAREILTLASIHLFAKSKGGGGGLPSMFCFI